MPRLPDTLKARSMLLLSAVFVLSHLLSLWLFEQHRNERVLLAEAADLAQRISGIVDLAYGFPAAERGKILAAAQTGFLAAYDDLQSTVDDACLKNTFANDVALNIDKAFSQHPDYDIRVCLRGADPALRGEWRDDIDMLVNIRFPDGETAAFRARLPEAGSLLHEPIALYLLLVMALSLLLAWLLIRRLIRPLEQFGEAASRLGRNLDAPPLVEQGPKELVQASKALNTMQAHVQRLLKSQAEMVAAISHDLKSALTRLQLRTELLSNDREREGLERVVVDMRTMVAAIIDFVRGNASGEQPRRTQLDNLLESLCDDLAEEGLPVSYVSRGTGTVECRPVALRRALQNLIDNALRYGGRAVVSLSRDDLFFYLDVEDEGPGIPEGMLGEVLRPFVRVDASRSERSGGLGLGLAIAQGIVQGHCGSRTLFNRHGGGLRAQIRLPASEGVARP